MEIPPNSPVKDTEALMDYSSDGVDLTLIRWFLSLTPAERLALAEEHAADITAIRELNGGQ